MPKILHYGQNAFVSSNKRKIDVRIRGERSEENMEEAVSWVIKGSDACSVMVVTFFHNAHYLALFVGLVLWDGGANVQLFLYFHCICVNNSINCSCDLFFCSYSLWCTVKKY